MGTEIQDTLFPEAELPPPEHERLRLVVCKPTPNYLRMRQGKPCKVALRCPERKGRIIATVYSGEDDAQYIADCVNAKAGG